MIRKFKMNDEEMSVIIWSLEEKYKRLEQNKTKESQKDYRRTKKLYQKLLKEYIQL